MSSSNLTKEEQTFIADNALKMSDKEIAEKLNRPVATISAFRIRKKLYGRKKAQKDEKPEDASIEGFSRKIRHSVEYIELQSIFSPAELRKFVRRWADYNMQFNKEGVLATEREQISQLVKLEILIDRNLIEQRQAIQEAKSIEDLIVSEEAKDSEDRNTEKLFELHKQLSMLMSAGKSQRKDLLDLQTRHGGILKDLKATRDQRVKSIEENKQSFLGMVKWLMQKEVKEREARQMELTRLAMVKQKQKFQELHDFGNNDVDPVLLNAETLELSDKANKETKNEQQQ